MLIFQLLKLKLLKENKNSLIKVLTTKISITFYRSSFINHFYIKVNH